MSATRTRGNLRAVLAEPDFRRLLGVRLVSQFADALFQAGLAGNLLFNPQNQTSPVGIATGFAVLLLPYSLIGPYVGVILDRWRRRNVIYLVNLVRAALVLPAAWGIWHHEQALFVASTLLVIGINRLLLSGLSAAQPHVVPRPLLVTANAAATTLGTVTYSLGLGFTALLVNLVVGNNSHGYAKVASVATLGYGLSALIAFRSFSSTQLGPEGVDRNRESVFAAVVSVARGMVAGVGHLATRRTPAYGIVAQSVHRFLYGVLSLITLLLFRGYFFPGHPGRALAGLGAVVVVGGFGALLAAFVTPLATRRIGGWRWVTALLSAFGLVLLALGLPFREYLLVAATFAVNLASQGMKIVVDTAIQRDCADEFRGRVFSVNDTAFNVCLVIGLFLGAATLPDDGHSPSAIMLVSAGYLGLALWYAIASYRWESARPTLAEVGPNSVS